ncbi:hypothetical protein [Nocardiopsis synnemataformans]|uniref:hypothetical protein n=1 Tax=Nocardiopsis synnemataformans TaxID=61305 RepID=UPI003EBF925F
MIGPKVAVWRPADGRLLVRMPFGKNNRRWLMYGLGPETRPGWNKAVKCWEIARPHFRAVVEGLAKKYGSVNVFIDSRATSTCDTRCAEAKGDECECQCLGENHGGAAYQKAWELVGDTTLIASEGLLRRHMRVVRP